jgi:hypothetical protein
MAVDFVQRQLPKTHGEERFPIIPIFAAADSERNFSFCFGAVWQARSRSDG